MKAQKLIASAAAVLFTFASLGIVSYRAASPLPDNGDSATINATELPGITVIPSAAERRAAALLNEVVTVDLATSPSLSSLQSSRHVRHFSLLGSQLVMPYYSFSDNFGRISKE